jgi:hypothetical protein
MWHHEHVSADNSIPQRRVIGRPFPPGVSGNPGGAPKGLAEVRRMAQERSPRAVERLGELVEDENGKVAIAACVAIYEIGWGKLGTHKDPAPGASDPNASNKIDLSKLSSAELVQFRTLALKAKASTET